MITERVNCLTKISYRWKETKFYLDVYRKNVGNPQRIIAKIYKIKSIFLFESINHEVICNKRKPNTSK